MTEILLPYFTNHYNKSPELGDASSGFRSYNGLDIVNGAFRTSIEKYGLQNTFGVGLLHRHSTLKGCERLVSMPANTSMLHSILAPWSELAGDEHFGHNIVADAWLIKYGKLMPSEFEFSTESVKDLVDPSHYAAFVENFMNPAAKIGLENTVSLYRFPGAGFLGCMETIQGMCLLTSNLTMFIKISPEVLRVLTSSQ
jgi:hypothetical protein